MPTPPNPRQSIPVYGREPPFTEEALHRHSFDLGLFPRYLESAAPRVHIVISERELQHPSLWGLYADAEGKEHSKTAFLQADEQGILTDSDAFYHAVHAAFTAQAGEAQYIGFTRLGRPPYAPLFALAMLYKKFGRGLYKAGDLLPTRWPTLTAQYGFRTG